jgi:hypothetical protein
MVGSVRGLFPLFAVAVMGIAASAAGCGGDDSGADEYRDDANAICREALREAEQLAQPRSPRQLERFLRDGLRASRGYTRRLEALEPPPELAELHERSLHLNLRAERLTQGILDELAAGGAPSELLPDFSAELLEIGKRDNELARRLGLPDCVLPLPGPGGEPAAPA